MNSNNMESKMLDLDDDFLNDAELTLDGPINGQQHQQVLSNSLNAPTMSQWAKVQQNLTVFRQMQLYYLSPFIMEVRYFLCQWIEDQQWNQIDENNPQYVDVAEKILEEMLVLLQRKSAELTSQEFFIIRYKLDESVQKMETVVRSNPLELVKIIKDCLAKEEQLLEQAEQAEQQQHMNQDLSGTDQMSINDKIVSDIPALLRKTTVTENDLKNMQQKQESFILKFSGSQRFISELQHIEQMPMSTERNQKEVQCMKQKEDMDIQLTQLAHDLQQHRVKLSREYEATIKSLKELQKEILNELISWKRCQQLASNGLIMDSSSLETLQQWCENLADLVWQNRQQIKKLTQLQQQLPIKYPDGAEDLLPPLNDTITGLLSSLVTSTFIVEQQPPQVLKKDARFGAVVRLLVGGKLNVHMNPPQVKATIISENQAKDLLRDEAKAKKDTSGDILNNSGTMEYQQSTGQLSINFRNMQLKKIKRADKKGSEAVTEEKFCILFQSEFSIGPQELVFQVWTLSLPVVVTVHGNQECNATGTVLWDNAFAAAGRVPFNVPDHVGWLLLADQLSVKFMSQTGKELTDTNRSYIASKLLGSKDPAQAEVTWSQFNKDPLPGRTFTFWEWFHAIQKLTKEHLKEMWMDEGIIGFVSKNQAQEWLNNKPGGTFLLRFSDSELGGITIAWTGGKTDRGVKAEVWNLAPFTTKDFNIRGLADRIKDLNSLVYLYPNKPKDIVFKKYYTSMADQVMGNDGYIRPELKTTIPPQFNTNTEMEKQPLSPDSVYDLNPSSVNDLNTDLDDLPLTPVRQFSDMNVDGFSQMDYSSEDIAEINVDQLLASYQSNM